MKKMKTEIIDKIERKQDALKNKRKIKIQKNRRKERKLENKQLK